MSNLSIHYLSSIAMKTEITFKPGAISSQHAPGGAVAWTVPTFLANTFAAMELEAAERLHKSLPAGLRHPDCLQMAGGNDGLDTIVPYSNISITAPGPDWPVREIKF